MLPSETTGEKWRGDYPRTRLENKVLAFTRTLNIEELSVFAKVLEEPDLEEPNLVELGARKLIFDA